MGVDWFCKHTPRPQATARLFCFPYAGVGGSAYRAWSSALPVALEVCPVQLPGRENRLREPPETSIPAIVDKLLPALLPQLNLPYAFFGHSMGAILASEVARALLAAGAPMPRHLIVSSARPAHMPREEPPLHGLPDREFVLEINRRYRGIPGEVLQQQELLALLLPCLRADLQALETHRPPRRAPMPIPIMALGGTDDTMATRAHLEAWRAETTGAFRLQVYPGDHFYLGSQRARVLADVSATLADMFEAPRLWGARA